MRAGRSLAAVALVVALVVAAAGPTGAFIGSAAGPVLSFDATRVFSPNGDGVKDRAAVRYSLSRAVGEVTLIVRYLSGGTVRVVHRGPQAAGPHVWKWDGRRGNGELVGDGRYVVAIVVPSPHGPVTSGTHRVDVDTRFRAQLVPERFGGPRSEPVRVFPRTKVVIDALPITAIAAEPFLQWGRVVIRNPAGDVVRRLHLKSGEWRGGEGWVLDFQWTARRLNVPLPVGDYQAVVTGSDKAGNQGRSSRLTIRVSSHRLVWHEETRQLPAAETVVSPCRLSTANDCGIDLDCGDVVPSVLFAGGLSYRSAEEPCEPGEGTVYGARSLHLVSARRAVRGIERARVAFAGLATKQGDQGTLSLGETTTTSAADAQSPWVEDPPLGDGQGPVNFLPRIPPSVLWSFSTTGDDAFDVDTFTIDLRFLAVE